MLIEPALQSNSRLISASSVLSYETSGYKCFVVAASATTSALFGDRPISMAAAHMVA